MSFITWPLSQIVRLNLTTLFLVTTALQWPNIWLKNYHLIFIWLFCSKFNHLKDQFYKWIYSRLRLIGSLWDQGILTQLTGGSIKRNWIFQYKKKYLKLDALNLLSSTIRKEKEITHETIKVLPIYIYSLLFANTIPASYNAEIIWILMWSLLKLYKNLNKTKQLLYYIWFYLRIMLMMITLPNCQRSPLSLKITHTYVKKSSFQHVEFLETRLTMEDLSEWKWDWYIVYHWILVKFYVFCSWNPYSRILIEWKEG